MSKKNAVPNAWDDDWESLADKQTIEAPEPAAGSQRVTRAERRVRHAEANKQLWESAEAPQQFHFLETREKISLKDEFKPAMKVLSRKPVSNHDVANGVNKLTLNNEDDSEEEERKRQEASFAERTRKAQLEREEKARKYAEARQRLFGEPEKPQLSPQPSSAAMSGDARPYRGKRRGRGGRDSQSTSPADRSPARPVGQPKQLYDPAYSTKPAVVQRSSRPATPKEGDPVRMPRGPDASGRGGFGFAGRGRSAT
ncbi:hypothetical protein LTR66_003800 [Elasticomyces elasticus]|nr:hypothetical protein LTR66_003800 [Elasticomyces elasticus]